MDSLRSLLLRDRTIALNIEGSNSLVMYCICGGVLMDCWRARLLTR